MSEQLQRLLEVYAGKPVTSNHHENERPKNAKQRREVNRATTEKHKRNIKMEAERLAEKNRRRGLPIPPSGRLTYRYGSPVMPFKRH